LSDDVSFILRSCAQYPKAAFLSQRRVFPDEDYKDEELSISVFQEEIKEFEIRYGGWSKAP
jgi:hypothetical protein